jgi:Haem-binding domain
MLALLKRLAVLLVFILVAVQFFQPARTNPPVDPKRELHAHLAVDAAVDAAVATVFERSCNDCHSYRSVWPWYSHVAPVSWLVVSDVNRGRKAVNFSEWAGYRPGGAAETAIRNLQGGIRGRNARSSLYASAPACQAQCDRRDRQL